MVFDRHQTHRFQEKSNLLAVMAIHFYLKFRETIFKWQQRLWHSLTSTTAINHFNPTTLPHQYCNNQPEPSVLLQPPNCAHSLSVVLPIPAVTVLIPPSALESCKLEFVYIHLFHRPIFFFFLRTIPLKFNSQHSTFIVLWDSF